MSKKIKILLVIASILYLVFSFVLLTIDFTNWDMFYRFLYAVLLITFFIKAIKNE